METAPYAQPAVAGFAERRQEWVAQYGETVAATLEAAHAAAEAARQAVVPQNTTKTYHTGWRVWERFCAASGLPVRHGDRGTLTTFVVWAYQRGKTDGTGYAPTSVDALLTAAVVGLRQRGVPVAEDDAAFARAVVKGHAAVLARAGDIRGRGKAHPANLDGLRRIAAWVPDTLTGARDLVLVLVSFHFAARSSEPAGLLLVDVADEHEGLVVDVRAGKTRQSIRQVAIPYADEPLICPVRAWHRWRTQLLAAGGQHYADPMGPAFRAIDRWGHIGAGMSPEAVTDAVARVAKRSGVPLRWTGHSLRSGFATAARRAGKDSTLISEQGGWAPDSRAMHGYMRRADRWTDNASAGLC